MSSLASIIVVFLSKMIPFLLERLDLHLHLMAFTAQKMKFSIKDFFSKWKLQEAQETADLVPFTEEILYGKLYFLCSVNRPVKSNSVSSLAKSGFGLIFSLV